MFEFLKKYITLDNLSFVGNQQNEILLVEELRNELADAFENLNVMATTITTNPMNIYISDSEHQSIHQS